MCTSDPWVVEEGLMSVRGDLGTIKLSDIFQMLSLTQEPQTLTVRGGEGKTFTFRRGERRKTFVFAPERVTVYFSGGLRAVPLGEILVNRGKITEEHLAEALVAQKGSEKPLGEILVTLGMVEQEDIDAAVRKQIEEEIYELLAWEHGEFEVSDGEVSQEAVEGLEREIGLTFNVTSLLMEAMRRIDEWETLKAIVPSLDDVYCWKRGHSAKTAHVTATWERRVCVLLGTGMTLRRMSETLKLSRFDAVTLMAQLVEEDQVERLPVAELRTLVGPALSRGDIEEGLALGERVSMLLPDDPIPRKRLAELYEKLDRRMEAAEHYSGAAAIYRACGEFQQALEVLEQALVLNRESAQVRRELMEAALAVGDTARAKRVGKELLVGEFAGGGETAVPTAQRLLEIGKDDEIYRLDVLELLVENREIDAAVSEVLALAQDISDPREPRFVATCQLILEMDPSRKEVSAVLKRSYAKSLRGLRWRLAAGRVAAVLAVLACVLGAAYCMLSAFRRV